MLHSVLTSDRSSYSSIPFRRLNNKAREEAFMVRKSCSQIVAALPESRRYRIISRSLVWPCPGTQVMVLASVDMSTNVTRESTRLSISKADHLAALASLTFPRTFANLSFANLSFRVSVPLHQQPHLHFNNSLPWRFLACEINVSNAGLSFADVSRNFLSPFTILAQFVAFANPQRVKTAARKYSSSRGKAVLWRFYSQRKYSLLLFFLSR